MVTRRTFMTAASGLVFGPRLAAASAQGANDRIRIGVIGTGGRARGLMNTLTKLTGNQLVAVCDVYEPSRLQGAKIAGPTAVQVTDYRRILDDKTIDAVLIGTPDHWHATMTLAAVAAGKDVYVEKPISHAIAEGVQMVKAVEASKQIVQTGTQQRSWDHWIQGRQMVREGMLGQISFAQTYWYQHPRVGNYAQVNLEQLDWKAWLGSAPDQPFRPERFFQWRHFWDFGGGGITDRRRALVHGRRGAHHRLGDRPERPHHPLGDARHDGGHARVRQAVPGVLPRHLPQSRGRWRPGIQRRPWDAEDRSGTPRLLSRRGALCIGHADA
jgi:hypothetical protein